ncbi:MAG: HD domain-containing protein [Patescibacteria group bacterium]|nr:HD domain-containing protein [Patescibacteria group bacterium]
MENISLPGPKERAAIVAMFAQAYKFFLGNDVVTLGHCQRSSRFGKFICDLNNLFFGLPPEEAEYALFLHDVGKMTTPGRIIRSRKVFPEGSPERNLINEHPRNGADMMWDLPDPVRDLALSHHEHWDGTGYPLGIKGEDIPEVARMMAVIDALDAIMSERSYKKGETLSEALKRIRDGAGSQFDPAMVTMVDKTIQVGGALADDLFLKYYPLSIR